MKNLIFGYWCVIKCSFLEVEILLKLALKEKHKAS